ncbi:LacI family DNA-binding transcriptional regulator [Marinococcus sp. PL1-022]|uniref:LacI family DNA-binding transcriptional regulator n=1 Tax=Marinococcus sp. PL1-022 TaxID=3095363 RepID=UPI0029C28FD6|nr:LacI family DNA-binding transcriptional regulator [Marinococcus sp. PL1-022]MDX6154183.1 LacI family DNA-binding transcriptional regulator [Marinococcus sp. PL1-022]
MRTTIYDIAERAEVSIATVSKVINNKGKIGEKTKQRVLAIMDELDYQPSTVASALTGKQTNTIGLLVPDIANSFFAELARSVEDTGHAGGFNVVICNTDNNPEKEIQYLWWLNQKRVDGIILGTGIQNTKALQDFMKQNIPLALVARDASAIDVDTVLVDDHRGGYEATKHLLQAGHTRIAFVVGEMNNSSDTERLKGFYEAYDEYGVSREEAVLVKDNHSIDDAKKSMLEALQNDPGITAVFALNDFLAIGCIQAGKEAGRQVPEDLSVVGFDDTFIATLSDPPLTTVAQPILEMGRLVTQMLVDRIGGKNETTRTVILNPELHVRKTTAGIKEAERDVTSS